MHEQIQSELAEIKTYVAELKTHLVYIREFMDQCDTRYAKKYVERFVWICIGGISALAVTQIQQAKAAWDLIF